MILDPTLPRVNGLTVLTNFSAPLISPDDYVEIDIAGNNAKFSLITEGSSGPTLRWKFIEDSVDINLINFDKGLFSSGEAKLGTLEDGTDIVLRVMVLNYLGSKGPVRLLSILVLGGRQEA